MEVRILLNRSLDELLRDARLGAPEATARLCGMFYPKVLTYMRYRVDAASAEDLTGEVFLRVLRHIREQKGTFVAWLFRIAGNVVVDHVRSKAARHERPLDESVPEPAAAAPAPSRDRSLEAALARLTDEQREFVTLKFVQGLSNAEIAEITLRSPEAIRALQFRALAALRDEMAARGEGGKP